MQRTGLAPHFAENGSIRKIIKMAMALPFLPPARAEDGLAAIDKLAAEIDVQAVNLYMVYIRRCRMFTHS